MTKCSQNYCDNEVDGGTVTVQLPLDYDDSTLMDLNLCKSHFAIISRDHTSFYSIENEA